MKKNTLFMIFMLLRVYQNSYAKQPVTHTHNGRTHTHFLPLSGLNHSHTMKKEVPKKIYKSKETMKGLQKRRKRSDLKKGRRASPLPPNFAVEYKQQPKKPEFCNVKVRVSSEKNFMGWAMTGSRGEGTPIPVKIENLYILTMPTRKTYITITFNPSTQKIAKVSDHRTGERYKVITFNFNNQRGGLFANHDYLLTLGGQWRTNPRSIKFSCPNAKGQYAFSLPRLKHIGIFNEG